MNLHEGIETCALCPRLCRPACPVVVGTGREAAVPTFIAGVIVQARRGNMSVELAREAATLCTDCGACESHCHIHHPLPELLSQARAEFVAAPPVEALRDIEGAGDIVAVETDDRPLAAALAKRLGEAVAAWPTGDALGASAVEHPEFEPHAELLRRHAGGRRIVVGHGGAAKALETAGVEFVWLHEAVGAGDLVGSCQANGVSGPVACCGGAGPLAEHHPDDAAILGRWWLDRWEPGVLADARCRNHLRACEGEVSDLVDSLVGELP